MSVNDICDCLKNDIVGLKATMISIYIQDLNEYNISGRVLATCELDQLKQVSISIKLIYILFFFHKGSFNDIWRLGFI
jgi:hypothetical protein